MRALGSTRRTRTIGCPRLSIVPAPPTVQLERLTRGNVRDWGLPLVYGGGALLLLVGAAGFYYGWW